MKIGIVGLGKMGGNIVRRLHRAGIEPLGFDRDRDTTAALARELGTSALEDLAGLVSALTPPRRVWMMLPAGSVTEAVAHELLELLDAEDILVDGGNSHFKDSQSLAARCAEREVAFVDVGVSGGVWGLENGYALMIGGPDDAVAALKPVFEALAPTPADGWLHCGPSGAGHFVKMIHNGIEYGMMQAYAEGLALLRGREEFDLDLAAVAESWRHGSVIRSWLLDLTAEFLEKDQALEEIEPHVADSGEGRWTALEAIEQGIPAPVTSLSLMMRFASQGQDHYSAKLLAMMRRGFGGHAVVGKE